MRHQSSPIYLDYCASTPLDPRVEAAMQPYFRGTFGNASSAHAQGRAAEAAVEDARERAANLLNCLPDEIIFTSGGSESDNLALRGAGLAMRRETGRARIVTTRAEHHAVSRTAASLAEWLGFEAQFVPVDSAGRASADAVEAAASGAALISLMLANNEVGTVQDVAALAEMAHRHGALFHTDAVQAGGVLALDTQALGADLLSLSAHKFYGPKGVGLLYMRRGTPMSPVITGGSHEHGLRAGTSNTPGIVGMVRALELARDEREPRTAQLTARRDQLIGGILGAVSGAHLTGHPTGRLPGHASFVFAGVDGNLLLMHLDARGVMASSGSACTTGNPEPSEVLLALGYSRELALSGLRLSAGIHTSEADIEYAIGAVAESVEAVRRLQSAYA